MGMLHKMGANVDDDLRRGRSQRTQVTRSLKDILKKAQSKSIKKKQARD